MKKGLRFLFDAWTTDGHKAAIYQAVDGKIVTEDGEPVEMRDGRVTDGRLALVSCQVIEAFLGGTISDIEDAFEAHGAIEED